MLICTALLVASAFAATAVPAKPTPIMVKQPDGTLIEIQIRGDERSHFILTEDNYLATERDGCYYYANTDRDGNILCSDFAVKPLEMRTSQEKVYLSTIDMSQVHLDLQKRAQLSAASNRAITKAPQLANANNNNAIGLFPGTHFPTKGQQKGLVVLVEFADKSFTLDDPYDYFYRMLNEQNFSDYGGTGSAKDFFTQNSQNQFIPQFDVFGPITLANNTSYYGKNDWSGNDEYPYEMAIEACQQLDDLIDFADYDRDNDGYIDNIFIFYAGKGEASGGGSNTVWPHAWSLTEAGAQTCDFDGVILDKYACSNEWEGYSPDGVGTFVHEFSHVMGLPDLYATGYSSAFTPGEWSAMDYGPYNNDGRTPPNYSIFERYALGWIEPEIIDGPLNAKLEDISSSNAGYIIPTSSDNEFFLLENRQQSGWDAYIPGHGMLIWHIDYDPWVWTNNSVNNTSNHQYVDLEEANNSHYENARDGNSFPGASNVTEFTDDTSPNMRTWDGKKLGLPITEITEDNGQIKFKVLGGRADIPAVTVYEATDITPEGFVAHWDTTELASSYLLSVYTREPGSKFETSLLTYAPGYNRKNVGNVTSYVVTDLEPQTTYYYSIIATNGYDISPDSREIMVVTTEPTFDYLCPTALDATDIKDNGFIANWEPIEGAVNYYVTVSTKEMTSTDFDVVDFADGVTNLPHGWTSNSKSAYANSAYSGAAIPALRLSAADSYISSPSYNSDVLGLTFWHRGSSVPADNKLIIYVLVGSNWERISTLPICNEAGGITTSLTDFPAGAHGVRIEYCRNTSKGSVAIDDINVEWNPHYTSYPLDGYDMFDAGAALSASFTDLQPASTYYYTVIATDGVYMSRESNEIAVTTSSNSTGIHDITADSSLRIIGRSIVADIPLQVFALDGRQVPQSGLAPGVYIVRTPTKAVKVAIK